jgi:adenylate cyclase
MRLRGVDIYFVESVSHMPAPDPTPSQVAANRSLLRAAADLTEAIAAQTDIEGIVDVVLHGLATQFGYERLMILNLDADRDVLTTLGSAGYEHSGVGSEVPLGHGIIGAAAAERRVLKVSDLSRVQRFARAILTSSDENRTRTIPLPSTIDGMSQIGVPLIAQGLVQGVLFAESRERFAFTGQDEAALAIVARQTAAAFVLAEHIAEETQSPGATAPSHAAAGRSLQVKHYAFDDSVFIDNAYVIKGLPGRLLVYMIEAHQREGRSEFTNRELRLASELRLPSIRDNLETRLVLLRRRLSEKNVPVQLIRVGRGRVALQLSGSLSLQRLVDPAGSRR